MAGTLSLPLLRGLIELQDALNEDDNILAQLPYPRCTEEFHAYLIEHKTDIENVVQHHLGVRGCHVCVREIWQSGSFNLCIPIILPRTASQEPTTIFIRFPLPYKVGEAKYPGNVEEKLRSEVATYLWLQERSPDVPIPTLYGFGLPDGQCFTHPRNAPFFERILWGARRLIMSFLGLQVPSKYVPGGLHSPFKSGYIILSEAKGESLHRTWEEHRHDKDYRSRLFRGLARVSLSLNETPLPRIGSLTLDSRGVITLSNRPLTLYFQMLENEGIPSGIPRQRTYTSVESYISDLLSFQDNKILHQPNAVHSQGDGEMQLAALTALRAVMHRFNRPEYRDGPFFLTLTDLHQSNIFVDEQWNIETIIDLEWACSQPVEMQLPPYWLTSRAVDQFDTPESIAEFSTLLGEYLDIYEEEESKRNGVPYQALIQRRVWETGSFWYFHAVKVPKGMYTVFNTNIQPLFNKQHCKGSVFDEVFWWYWGVSAQDMIKKKIQDKEEYKMQVNKAFGAATPAKADLAVAN